jgi:putative salt-induced outer membrane protein
MKRSAFLLCSSLILAANVAHAEWTAKAEAGVVAARGNTEADSANLKADLVFKFAQWQHQLGATGVYQSDNTGTTGQRWEVRQQSDYDFSAQGFAYESLRYESDRFSGFTYQATAGSGVGWRFFDDPITKLNVRIGVGYKQYETRDALADDGVTIIPGERKDEMIGQGKGYFEHVLTETTKIVDKALVESGSDNTFAQNDLSLQVQIMGSLALAVGVSVRYNTNPPPGFLNTDTLTTLNLVYEHK